MDLGYQLGQRRILTRASRSTSTGPLVVPAGGDLQQSAHRGYGVHGLVRPHELEGLGGTESVSRANQAAAFARSPAPSSAAGSHDAAGEAPPSPLRSSRPLVDLRPGPPGGPSSGSPVRTAQTPSPAPPGPAGSYELDHLSPKLGWVRWP